MCVVIEYLESDNIYILGSCFDNYHAWIEGGLDMAINIIDKIKISKTKSKETVVNENKKTNNDKLKKISLDELKKHNTTKSLWTVIQDRKSKIKFVYDLTEWQYKHPGGKIPIMSVAGKDATEKFYNMSTHPIDKAEKKYYLVVEIGILI